MFSSFLVEAAAGGLSIPVPPNRSLWPCEEEN